MQPHREILPSFIAVKQLDWVMLKEQLGCFRIKRSESVRRRGLSLRQLWQERKCVKLVVVETAVRREGRVVDVYQLARERLALLVHKAGKSKHTCPIRYGCVTAIESGKPPADIFGSVQL